MKSESHITHHTRDMANAKILGDGKLTDRQRDGRIGQKVYAPGFLIRGHVINPK